MELSAEVQQLLQKFKKLNKDHEIVSINDKLNTSGKHFDPLMDELLDLSDMNTADTETWLFYDSNSHNMHSTDIHNWLYGDQFIMIPTNLFGNTTVIENVHNSPQRKIDTRTFTRPKKNISRPSIEKYNEELFASENDKNDNIDRFCTKEPVSLQQNTLIMQQSPVNKQNSMLMQQNSMLMQQNSMLMQQNSLVQENPNIMQQNSLLMQQYPTLSPQNVCQETAQFNDIFVPPTKPLDFDLSQPVCETAFNNIFNKDPDSFQNMSPPSLVNSMSSSTFTNLMESSLISNDPVLREIRDADYSGECLLADFEIPLYQSMTDSISSVNSDVVENFLYRKLGPSYSFRRSTPKSTSKNISLDEKFISSSPDLNSTFKIETGSENSFGEGELVQTGNNTFCKDESPGILHSENIDPNSTVIYSTAQKLNNTFHKNSTLDGNKVNNLGGSFNKSLDATFCKNKSLDATFCKNTSLDSTFCKNTSLNNTFSKNPNGTFSKNTSLDGTYCKNTGLNETFCNNKLIDGTFTKNSTVIQNETNNSNSLLNNTFSKNSAPRLDGTFKRNKVDRNSTFRIKEANSMTGNTKNLSRLLYGSDTTLNTVYNNEINDPKSNSYGLLAGSTDSLDYVSNLSNTSSKGSNKMLNMAEVDAIIEMQEQSLDIISTPKSKVPALPLQGLDYSPVTDKTSDTDLSSGEEYATVRSSLSKPSSMSSSEKDLLNDDRPTKSLGNLPTSADQIKPRSINTLTSGIASMKKSTIMGSYSNLLANESNLKRVGLKFGGSLKSLNRKTSDSTVVDADRILPQDKESESKKLDKNEVFKVPSLPTRAKTGQPSSLPKPRPSALPRPVSSTGIPRPVSKIPGPQSSTTKLVPGRSSIKVAMKKGKPIN